MIGRAPREATGADGKLVEATTVTASLELTWCNIVPLMMITLVMLVTMMLIGTNPSSHIHSVAALL